MYDDILHKNQQLEHILIHKLYNYPNLYMINNLVNMVHNNPYLNKILVCKFYRRKDHQSYILYIQANSQQHDHQKRVFHLHNQYNFGLDHKSHIVVGIIYINLLRQYIIHRNILNILNHLQQYLKINNFYNLVNIQHIYHFHSLSNLHSINNKQVGHRIHHKLNSY